MQPCLHIPRTKETRVTVGLADTDVQGSFTLTTSFMVMRTALTGGDATKALSPAAPV